MWYLFPFQFRSHFAWKSRLRLTIALLMTTLLISSMWTSMPPVPYLAKALQSHDFTLAHLECPGWTGNKQHNCRYRLAHHPRFCHWCSHCASGRRIRGMHLLLLYICWLVALNVSSHARLSDCIFVLSCRDILCTHICHVVTITCETFLVGHYFIPKTHPTGITYLVVAFPYRVWNSYNADLPTSVPPEV